MRYHIVKIISGEPPAPVAGAVEEKDARALLAQKLYYRDGEEWYALYDCEEDCFLTDEVMPQRIGV